MENNTTLANDLTVDGDGFGKPISIRKFLESHATPTEAEVRGLAEELGIYNRTDKDKPLTPLTLLVDGSGCGFAKDSPDLIYITPEECRTQALYYVKTIFDGKRIPAYLYRHMSYMFKKNFDKQFETDAEVVSYFNEKDMTQDRNYKTILGMITHCENSSETTQVIGLIQLVTGTLSAAKKANKGVRLYFDRPETALHPNTQSTFVSWLLKTCTEYGMSLGSKTN